MEAKQYADVLSARLSPEVFKPAPGRALWLPVHASIAALCMFAIVAAHPGVLTRIGLSIRSVAMTTGAIPWLQALL